MSYMTCWLTVCSEETDQLTTESLMGWSSSSSRKGDRGGRTSTGTESRAAVMGLLKVRVLRGINLAVRDIRSSDPYVIVKIGSKKLKTHVVKKNVNPVWNEDLTLSVIDPTEPIRVEVYDKDTFSRDDQMGNAELDIQPFIEVVKMKLENTPSGNVIKKLSPSRHNCLADDSSIYISDGRVVQDVILRLRDVECGEVELQLQWISVPNSRR